MMNLQLFPSNFSITQKVRRMTHCHRQLSLISVLFRRQVVVISVATGVAILGVLATYTSRRKVRPIKNQRIRTGGGGRRTRNSMRSPNGMRKFSQITMCLLTFDISIVRCYVSRWFKNKCKINIAWRLSAHNYGHWVICGIKPCGIWKQQNSLFNATGAWRYGNGEA